MIPKVSIVIPCFNSVATIGDTLESALNQTYSHVDVIVVDDGSTDKTLDIVKSFGGRVRWVTGQNAGACAARNKGLSIADGDFVQFLDADDLIDPHKIASQISSLKSRPPGSIAACAWTHFSEHQGYRPRARKHFWRDYSSGFDLLVDMWLHGGYLPQHCWLVPRETIAAVGGWDETLAAGQDWDFFGRVLLVCGEVAFNDEVCVYYRLPQSANVSTQVGRSALVSQFRATESTAEPMLKIAGDTRTRLAVRNRWHRLAYHFAPHDLDLAVQAARRARNASPSLSGLLSGPKSFRMVARIVGVEAALAVRVRLRRMAVGASGIFRRAAQVRFFGRARN